MVEIKLPLTTLNKPLKKGNKKPKIHKNSSSVRERQRSGGEGLDSWRCHDRREKIERGSERGKEIGETETHLKTPKRERWSFYHRDIEIPGEIGWRQDAEHGWTLPPANQTTSYRVMKQELFYGFASFFPPKFFPFCLPILFSVFL